MRVGVLDIGSNTGHLLVVDAHGGAAPLPAYSFKEPLRLAEHLDEHGAVSKAGTRALTDFVADSLRVAEDKGCEEILGFATSAVRDAVNSEEVLRTVSEETGVDIQVLPGEDEARLTFLAVRRWFGWSSGRLMVFDIGGGSLEIATGGDEAPDVAQSLPLGAGRLTREWLAQDPPDPDTVRSLRRKGRADIPRSAGLGLRPGRADHAGAAGCRAGREAPRAGDDDRREAPAAPRRLAQPVAPAGGRRHRGRGGHGHLRGPRARDLSLGAARGDHPRAARREQRPRLTARGERCPCPR